MNIYITTESEQKLNVLFSNIKNFYIIDVQSFINSFKLDLSKQYNIFFLNSELLSMIKSNSKLKKYQGIIYINKNLNTDNLTSLKKKIKNIKNIDKTILIDNKNYPKLQKLYSICEEIYFYERFSKNKIIDYNGIFKEEEQNNNEE